MSLFGLHRRLRGALVGHLAAFEMTSSIPNRRYGDGLRRLGVRRRRDRVLRRARGGRRRPRGRRRERPRGRSARRRAGAGGRRPVRRSSPVRGRGATGRRTSRAPGQATRRRCAPPPLLAGLSVTAPSARGPPRRSGAWKRTSLCVPSQNGRRRDLPQRQSATVSAVDADLVAVLVDDLDRPADEERSVAVRGDAGRSAHRACSRSSSGFVAGPVRTAPSASNREP